jgi:hypothetical protein
VGLEAQACAPGPAIFFPGHLHFFFKRKNWRTTRHLLWQMTYCLLAQNSTTIIVAKKTRFASFFYKKNSFFHQNTYFQPFQPQNTLKTPRNQHINLIKPKRSRPLKQTIKNIASFT